MSLVSAVFAVGLHLTALSQFGQAVRDIARAVTVTDSERDALKSEADTYLSRGAIIGYIGLAFALASIGFVALSALRHERASRSLTFAILFVYLLLQFVMI